MAIDEQSRHRMYLKLEEALGPEAAATMMEHLPPVGWADVATKRDLDHLKLDLELGFQNRMKDMELRFERALHAQTIKFMAGMTTIATTIAAIALAIARLT